jgi:hypothetical protein
MGWVKDCYEILAGLWDRLSAEPRRKKLNLSEDLGAIASLLDAAREKFERKQVPRREAKELAILVNHADQLASAFKKQPRELVEVFEKQLPRIGALMRDADYFIDGRPRYSLQPAKDTDDPAFHFHAEDVIRQACEEMQRAAGIISAYSRKYQQGGRA